jgi:hypothetical protein
MACFIISFISINFKLSVVFANQHHASIARVIGLNGEIIFQKGVVFVRAHSEVVGEDCQVVSA